MNGATAGVLRFKRVSIWLGAVGVDVGFRLELLDGANGLADLVDVGEDGGGL